MPPRGSAGAASFALLAAFGGVALLLTWLFLPETLGPRDGGRGAGAMFYSYVRLLRSRAFCGYAIGGACTTTSFYAFMSASPFIFEHMLHRPPQEVGLYYLVLMGGVGLGGLSANRLAGRVRTAHGAADREFAGDRRGGGVRSGRR